MQNLYEETNHGLKIKMPEEIDHYVADQIRQEVDTRIEQGGVSNLIFDFQNTGFMDSSGIGLLLGRLKMVSYIGGTVVAVHVSESIYRMMKLSGIEKCMKISNCESKED